MRAGCIALFGTASPVSQLLKVCLRTWRWSAASVWVIPREARRLRRCPAQVVGFLGMARGCGAVKSSGISGRKKATACDGCVALAISAPGALLPGGGGPRVLTGTLSA